MLRTNFDIHDFLMHWRDLFPGLDSYPWAITAEIESLVDNRLRSLDGEYFINGRVAIHKTATVEENCVIKGPVLISASCFVGAHAYLRGGVFLGTGTSIGPGCEIKTSLILQHTALAHFNFAGDSIIGSDVNIEAGAILANHYNERKNKNIEVMIDGRKISTGVNKFGSLIGDGSKIGANAVLSPGTILHPDATIRRLELVEQC